MVSFFFTKNYNLGILKAKIGEVDMTNMYFLISGFFVIVLIVILFFSNKRIDSKETKLYGLMILCNLVNIILVMLEIFLGYCFEPGGLVKVFVTMTNKFDLINYVLWPTLLFLYVHYITYRDSKSYYILKKGVTIIDCIAIVVEFLLPIELINQDGVMGVAGPASNFVFIVAITYMLGMAVMMLLNIKKVFSKKYIPLIVLLALMVVAALVRATNPTLIIIPTILVYIDLIMYNTIENPDVKMIEELNLAREQAIKANNAKTEFLSHMSHEVRTPLNAIINFSNNLKDELPNENLKKEAGYIVEASTNLLEIVNGILDVSKIEAGKIEIVNVEYETSKMLENLVSLSKGRLGSKKIEFKTAFDPSLPKFLYGDETRIKQICVNLLTNSIKYTNEGYIEFQVSSVVMGDVCRLIISVEDTGIGIKSEDIDKLFDKFSRLELEKNISIEGSGLGLAITKKLVEMMNGKIVVQSEYGKGSKFTVAIDQRIVDVPKPKEEFDVESIVKCEFPGKMILVIDDNKMNLRVAEKVLEPYKVSITTASSGDEGIAKIIEDNTYDLVLLDDMMPDKSGTETLKELKETFSDYKTPTVALTANAIVGMKEKYLEAGFDDYLAKPIEKEELKRVLNRFLK